MRNPPLYAGVVLAAAAVVLSMSQTTGAAEISKANNADALNLSTSWLPTSPETASVVPGPDDVAVWGSTVAAANSTVLGGDLSWQGVKITSPGGTVTIGGAANRLTLGTSGVDLSSATRDLTMNSLITVGSAQTWNVGTGRYMRVSGGITAAAGNTITKDGVGGLELNATNTALAANINLNGGTLYAKQAGSALGTGTINMANGTTLHMWRVSSTVSTFVGNGIAVASGATASISSEIAANGYSGLVSGDAGSTFAIAGATQVSLDRKNDTANGFTGNQLANLLGTLRVNSGSSVRFSASSALDNGGINTSFDVLGNLTVRNGGTVRLGALTGNGTITGGGAADGLVTYVVGQKNTNSNFSGSISNGSTAARPTALTKAGSAVLTLSGANNYSGATAVQAGTLLVNGTNGGTGAVTVSSQATLGGIGSIAGAVTVNAGGFLAPGASIESLDVAAADIDGTLLVEYDTDAATTIDLLAVTGNLDITNATVDFNNFDLESDALTGEPHVFATYGTLTGLAFANEVDVPAGYEIDYDYNSNSIALVTAVPEPASLGLIGLAAVAGLRRRRMARSA